ncbi:FMN-dependent NADH-azoreductase [filamentous cyanobacterium CCP2]|nr:FMN-dependent NADH-azoreductase [filamentous cyanobacterium CCP2]
MKTLLHIDVSARKERSLSRSLSKQFIQEWQIHHPDDRILYRDLGENPPPIITESWIGAVFTSEKNRTAVQRSAIALSDELIAELEQANLIVLGTPMYNYGMPAALKAWFDQVIRIGKTFSFDLARGDYPLEPILSGKTLVLLSSSGEFGFAPGGIREKMNHLAPHVQTCSMYLGVDTDKNFHHIGIEYQEFGDSRHQRSIQEAHEAVSSLVKTLSQCLNMGS